MKILISNDDGIQASGIRAMMEVLSAEHDVYVIAPDGERSAAGHSITLHTPLRVEEIEPKFNVKRAWMITGTPGDCVKIGLNAVLSDEEKPDIVISGPNHGPNLGTDILYSGTVSAALEGAILGYPSIAISVAGNHQTLDNFYYAAEFIKKFLPNIQKVHIPPKSILNINVPSVPSEDITGLEITKLGTRMYTDTYEKRTDPRGKVYYWLAGELITKDAEIGTDIEAIRNNKVSITPV
ncbi:MAG: 5'/3'-nucleotidase SurE, partial [Candidatus Gastranaerophilales bacterium]|nr:5'/3'-nucleotidase SurE [Candidatus Gastranaerophilales bacterium]